MATGNYAVIIDYEVGNIRSVSNAVKMVSSFEALVTADPEVIANSSCIILPGVGAFDDSMKALRKSNLIPILEKEAFEKRKPFLGICVGMQILFDGSEEGTEKGLGWLPGTVKAFSMIDLPVPHFGWNNIEILENNWLFEGLSAEKNFYFAHSFHVDTPDEYCIATCEYGYKFPVMVKKDQIYGMQFHPERSHNNGLKLLGNFINSVEVAKCSKIG